MKKESHNNKLIYNPSRITIKAYSLVLERNLDEMIKDTLSQLFLHAQKRQNMIESLEKLMMETLWERLTISQKNIINEHQAGDSDPQRILEHIQTQSGLLAIVLDCERSELGRLRRIRKAVPPEYTSQINTEMEATRETIRSLKSLLEQNPTTQK